MIRQAESRSLVWGAAIAALTSVHHVYGAIVYETPWRLHAVALSGAALLGMLVALYISRRYAESRLGRAAGWVFWAVDAVVLVLLIGAFEGGYNHLLKNVLWLGGLPMSDLRVLFPGPTYELPNDVFFEVSGVAQVIPAAFAARWLGALLAERAGRHTSDVVLRPGHIVPPRALVTVAGEPIEIPDRVHRVHLQLRRFAGCPVCNLHLRSMVRQSAAIEAAGVREVVVFHSNAEDLRRYEGSLPFAIIADPDKRLYRELGVESSPRALLDPRAWPGIVRAVLASTWGLVKGLPLPPLRPPGGRYGLPADFLIDTDGRVLAVKYGEHADDQWSVEELLTLAAAAGSRSGDEAL
jgi:peroxiredoxin